MMLKIKEDGYNQVQKQKGSKMDENDLIAVFKLVDMDKSGEISKTVNLQ